MLIRIGVCAALCLGTTASASAQIYTWRDGNGNLVLSNQARAGTAAVRSYAVPESPRMRAPRFAPAERTRLYDDAILQHASMNGVRAELVRAVVQVESAFNPNARSPKGALGLMQLMPATALRFGVSNPFNPTDNVRAGVAYLRQLLDRYQNDEELALAAYNAGPEAVDRHGRSVPPYRETRNYVAQVRQVVGQSLQATGGRIYKVTELIDGRAVVRYTDRKPSTGAYELMSTR